MPDASPAATGRIFISYRREETAYAAGWLFDRLADRFGAGQIFKDVDSIELGDDFVEVISAAVGSCDVLLALIGDEWVSITDEEGERRLDDPDDFVRLEIEAALARNVRVIPILVDGARMPRAADLPPSLARLVRRQALELSPARFDFDTGRLLKVLERTLAEVRTEEREAASRRAPPVKPPAQGRTKARKEPERREAGRARTAGVPPVAAPVPEPPPEPEDRKQLEEQRLREEERRRRRRKQVVGAAIAVAALGGLALLIAALAGGDGESRSALLWQRAGASDLGGRGDQAMVGIFNTSRGGLAYVAGGYDGAPGDLDAAVWTSRDGRTWQQASGGGGLGGPGDQTVRSVTNLAGTLVAVGWDDSSGDRDAALWRSVDGTSWEAIGGLRVPGTDEAINRLNNVEGRLLGGGRQSGDDDDGAVWIFERDADPSTALVTDSDFGGPGDQRINRVIRTGETLVAVGFADGDAGVWVSEDAEAWDRVDVAALGGDGEQEILDATRSGSEVVAVGLERVNGVTTGAVWLSEDGRDWTRVQDPDGVLATPAPARINRIVAAAADVTSRGVPALIAGGSAGGDAAVWTSTDGREWKREPDPQGVLGGPGEQVIHSFRANQLPVIAVGSSGVGNGIDAVVWLGARPR